MPRIVYVTLVQAAAARLRLRRHEEGIAPIKDEDRIPALRAIASAKRDRRAGGASAPAP